MIPVVPRGDEPFDFGRSNVVSLRIHVAKNRRNFLPLQCVRRGDECVSRHNDFSAQFEGTDGNLQGNSRVAHGDAMLRANELPGFELQIP